MVKIFEPATNTGKVFEPPAQTRTSIASETVISTARTIETVGEGANTDAASLVSPPFEAACYGEFLAHTEELSRCEEPDKLLNLLETHVLRRIVRNSIRNQAKLLAAMYEQSNIEKVSNETLLDLPQVKYQNEVESLLGRNFEWLEGRLRPFQARLTAFRAKIKMWTDQMSDDSYEGSAAGSFLGGCLFGYWGALVGAVLGSGGDGSAKDECEREVRALVSDYESLLNEVKESLDQTMESTAKCIQKLAQRKAMRE